MKRGIVKKYPKVLPKFLLNPTNPDPTLSDVKLFPGQTCVAANYYETGKYSFRKITTFS